MKNKKVIIIGIIIILVIATIVGVVIYRHSRKNEPIVSGEVPAVNPTPTKSVQEQILNHTSTEDMKGQTPLINMENKENVKIDNGEKVNSSEYMKQEKEVSGLKISNISLYTESGLSHFHAIVENTTEEEFKGRGVKLIFKKSDGTTLTNVETLIPTIKAKGSTTINASTTQDIVNAIDVKIEFK